MLETVVLAVLIGFAAGFVGGVAGIGGGVVIVPGLVLLLGAPQHLAQGTSLAVIVPTALMATVTHARNHYIVVTGAVAMAAAGIATAQVGSRVALGVDAGVLRKIFGAYLLLVGVQTVWRKTRVRNRK